MCINYTKYAKVMGM